MKLQVQSLVGKTKDEIKSLLENSGFNMRVNSEDGKFYIGTRDLRSDRIKVDFVGGKATSVRVE